MIVSYWGISETVEYSKPINIVPYRLVVRMENMSSIAMNLDPCDFFCIHVSSNIVPFVNY